MHTRPGTLGFESGNEVAECRSHNEDAFLSPRGVREIAERVHAGQVTASGMWRKWFKMFDSSLLGTAQSTFLTLLSTASKGKAYA
jgi:hypothetical protein